MTHLPFDNIDKYKATLRGIGKPTIFEINIPTMVECVSNSEIGAMIYEMFVEWLYFAGNLREASRNLDNTLSFRKPIPPGYIHSHYHPVEIPDPGTGGRIYNTEIGKYEEDSEC